MQEMHALSADDRLKYRPSSVFEIKLPYYFYYYYYSLNLENNYSDSASFYSKNVRDVILSFKDGNGTDRLIDAISEQLSMLLRSNLGDEALKKMAFVCVPASTVWSNTRRYEALSHTLCEQTGMLNAFPRIKITREVPPKHIYGDRTAPECDFDTDFFRQRNVVLFDDIVTKGISMRNFANKLKNLGANIRQCVALGQTYYFKRDGVLNSPHPWSGKSVIKPGDQLYIGDGEVMENELHKIIVPVQIIKVDQERPVAAEESAAPEIKTVPESKPEQTAKTQGKWLSSFEELAEALGAESAKEQELEQQQWAEQAAIEINEQGTGYDYQERYNVGDTVTFGKFKGAPIKWVVLENTKRGALIISKVSLTHRPYNDQPGPVTWDKSSLRSWLNHDFYDQSFNSSEKKSILRHFVEADVVDGHELSPGRNTNDFVHLLSISEYLKYYCHIEKIREKVIIVEDKGKFRWNNRMIIGKGKFKPCQCWLRNYGVDLTRAAFVGRSGKIHEGGSLVESPRNAVRPVMLVRL